MTVGEPWFWWHLEMVKTEISKRTKKPIIHNSTISSRLIHLKIVVEQLRATRFSKKLILLSVKRNLKNWPWDDRGRAVILVTSWKGQNWNLKKNEETYNPQFNHITPAHSSEICSRTTQGNQIFKKTHSSVRKTQLKKLAVGWPWASRDSVDILKWSKLKSQKERKNL